MKTVLTFFQHLFSSGSFIPEWQPKTRDVETIAALIETWTEQKIHDVLGFCQDGKMEYRNPCACLIGVHSSEVLHTQLCFRGHFSIAIQRDQSLRQVESAYAGLAGPKFDQSVRDKHFERILWAEIRRREARRELAEAVARSAGSPLDEPVAKS